MLRTHSLSHHRPRILSILTLFVLLLCRLQRFLSPAVSFACCSTMFKRKLQALEYERWATFDQKGSICGRKVISLMEVLSR